MALPRDSAIEVQQVEGAALAALRDWVLEGRLRPGTRIRVAELANALGTSAMPVRGALRQLESEGLITRVPNRGLWVAELRPEEIRDLYDVRLLLEPVAAARGVSNLSERARAALPHLVAELEEAVSARDTSRMLTADEDLLIAIYECAGSLELVRMIRGLWQRVRPYKMLYWSGQPEHAAPELLIGDAHRIAQAALSNADRRASEVVASSVEVARDALVQYASADASAAFHPEAASPTSVPLGAGEARMQSIPADS
jgi:DNA-binding GntR family transcriptional regulator